MYIVVKAALRFLPISRLLKMTSTQLVCQSTKKKLILLRTTPTRKINPIVYKQISYPLWRKAITDVTLTEGAIVTCFFPCESGLYSHRLFSVMAGKVVWLPWTDVKVRRSCRQIVSGKFSNCDLLSLLARLHLKHATAFCKKIFWDKTPTNVLAVLSVIYTLCSLLWLFY